MTSSTDDATTSILKSSPTLKSGSSWKSGLKNMKPSKDKIVIVVDETQFMVDRDLFMSQPDTMLSKMFSPAMLNECGMTRPNDRDEYEINVPISALVFKALLDYYTESVIVCPPGVAISQLRSACEYFLIPFNATTIKSHDLGSLMHEISNDGAHAQFIIFLDQLILPLMVRVAQKGERECHLVVLKDDDHIEWDAEFPPMVGEEYTETTHSTRLHRFFRYIENREVAKRVLKDRGLKKIRLGIEGWLMTS